MAQVDTPPVPPRPFGAHPVVKALAGAAILGLAAFISVEGLALYREFRSLRAQESRTDLSSVIGYEGIHAVPNYAMKPVDWIHDEGGQTLLWAGWKDGRHDWFHIDLGDLGRDRVSEPMGRDVVRAIDRAIVEREGGPRWGRVPGTALVAGLDRGRERVAYPMLVLKKVEVVNDTIGDEPVLIVYRPFAAEAEAVSTYDPVLDGRRITMGLSGYLIDKVPVLYDRGTRSLWMDRDGAMTAIAGPRKGASLRKGDGVRVQPWSEWRSRHPEGRLVVGADRSRGVPEL